ncbi:MAG TPA: BMP family ABC transporter substrate-binding protein [Clostridia bacterium]|nr:BMP family ABC transporter substrate-binding protein [Clostridia bacterium]
MKKLIATVLAVLLLCSMATACAPGAATTPANGGSAKKAACILGVGGLGDQSYNDLVYSGMKKAESELGISFDYAEPKQISEFELIMRDMASSGQYSVIVCVGFDQVDPLTKVAPEFPDQKFALIDGVVEGANIANYTCMEEEGSFLVGALAGLMKKNAAAYSVADNNTIGFIAAMEIPLLVKFNAGYQAGAKFVNPDINVLTDYVGGNNPFSDTTTAKEIALTQNSKGADIIYHAAGGSGLGVFQAAAEQNFKAIGVNSNQNVLDPDHIVASMLKRVDTAAFEIVKAACVDGNLAVGSTIVLGVKDDGVGYTLEGSNIKVSDEDVAIIEGLRAKIADGTLVIPTTLEEVDSFLAANAQ